ncbi:MAG: DMT family transporter [Gammaproteobacteria bacterium]
MSWLLLALLSAFAIATADTIVKRNLQDYQAYELVLVRFSLTGLLFLPVLAFLPFPELPPNFWLLIMIMVPCEILGMFLYMKAIRDYPLYLTLPYLAFTPVIISVMAFLLLGERLSLVGITGILLVVAGSYVLNFETAGQAGKNRWLEPLYAAFSQRGAQLMLLVAFLYSITATLGKAVISDVPPLFFATFYFVIVGFATLLLVPLLARIKLRRLLRKPVATVMVAIFMAVMIISHFLALAEVEAAYMITVKRTSLLFGLIYGAWLFGERRLGQHLLAGSVMILGVFCIYQG